MGEGLFTRREICNLLLATYQAHCGAMQATDGNTAYHNGFRAAVSAMALSFGLNPGLVLPEQRERRAELSVVRR